MKPIVSGGFMTSQSSINPEFGGKFYRYLVTLDNHSSAYSLQDGNEYLTIQSLYPNLSKGERERFGRNVANGDRVIVEYIPWKGMNVITSIDFEDPEKRNW